MSADGADREHLPTTAGEEDLFIADLANQHRAIGEIAVRDSVSQVGLVGLAGFRHVTLRQRRMPRRQLAVHSPVSSSCRTVVSLRDNRHTS
jgi:hypothetical protein